MVELARVYGMDRSWLWPTARVRRWGKDITKSGIWEMLL